MSWPRWPWCCRCMGTERDRSGADRYEVRDYQGGGLKVIVWVEPGQPPLIMTSIAAGRRPCWPRR